MTEMTVHQEQCHDCAQAQPLGWRQSFFRKLLFTKLKGLSSGKLLLKECWDQGGEFEFGRSCESEHDLQRTDAFELHRGANRSAASAADKSPAAEHGLTVTLWVNDPAFYQRAVLGGSLGVAESLLQGEWSCSDLTALVRMFIRDLRVTDSLRQGLSRVSHGLHQISQWIRRNTVAGSRRNIAAHYDLGNDFYRLWLDDTLNYSCGIFRHAEDTMASASIAKMDRICQLLQLNPGDHVVEIGTGWGGFAVYAATHYGCRVTTTTISEEQFRYASQRVMDAGLSDRVRVVRKDYRHLTPADAAWTDSDGTPKFVDAMGSHTTDRASVGFDKLVSIEMIEAVGHQFYPVYFQKCDELLKPDGQAVLQAIVIADERYEFHRRSVDFISQYIFPGGMLPSISAMTSIAASAGGLRLLQLDDFAPHYAETLRRWRRRFHDQLASIHQLGFDRRFIRMWDYYLAYCEAAFEESQVNLVQLHFAKRGYRKPLACGSSGNHVTTRLTQGERASAEPAGCGL